MLGKCALTILELNWNQLLGHKKTKSNICHHMLTVSVSVQFQFYYSLKKLHNNFLCSHIAQLVEAGRGHLNIKQFSRRRLRKERKRNCKTVHTTAKQVISRRRKNENVFKMSKDEKCTCKACKNTVFHCQICRFVRFLLPSSSWLLKLPNVFLIQLGYSGDFNALLCLTFTLTNIHCKFSLPCRLSWPSTRILVFLERSSATVKTRG